MRNTNVSLTEYTHLERALIRAAFARYREWRKRFGEPKPWGTQPNVATKLGWKMLMATKKLYEAKRGRG